MAEDSGKIADKTAELWTLMRRKSARELAAIGRPARRSARR